MRSVVVALGLLAALPGCGVEVDPRRAPAQIRSEIRRHAREEVEPVLEAVEARIAEEEAALAALDERLADLPPAELFGERAPALADEVAEREDTLARLRAQRAVYRERLEAIAREEAEERAGPARDEDDEGA